jgi:uncharacterized membrane protein
MKRSVKFSLLAEEEVYVRAPASQVYAVVADPRNVPKYVSDVTEVVCIGPGTYRWAVDVRFGMRAHWTTTTTLTRPSTDLSYKTTLAGVTIRWSISVTAGGLTTKVVERIECNNRPLARFALALLGRDVNAEIRGNLRRLKQLLENAG